MVLFYLYPNVRTHVLCAVKDRGVILYVSMDSTLISKSQLTDAPPCQGAMADASVQRPSPPPASPFKCLLDLEKSLRSHFFNAKKSRQITVTHVNRKTDEISETISQVPLPPPSFLMWCNTNGVRLRELKELVLKDKDLRDTVEECYLMAREFVIDNGLTGLYETKFAQFYATSEFKMVSNLLQINVTDETPEKVQEGKHSKRKKILAQALDQLEDSNTFTP